MKHLIVILLILSLITAISAYQIYGRVPTENYPLSILLGRVESMPVVKLSVISDTFEKALSSKVFDVPVLGQFFEGIVAVGKIIVFVPVLLWNGINVAVWLISGAEDPYPSSVGGGGGGRGGR